MPPKMLTTAEVAAILRVGARTVRNLIDRGELGATRVGARRWVVAEATLDAYVVAHTSKGNVVPMTTTRSA